MRWGGGGEVMRWAEGKWKRQDLESAAHILFVSNSWPHFYLNRSNKQLHDCGAPP